MATHSGPVPDTAEVIEAIEAVGWGPHRHIEIDETTLRVYDERGDILINQTPRTSTKPLARFKAYGVHRNRTTG
jgi:hypothetical protein